MAKIGITPRKPLETQGPLLISNISAEKVEPSPHAVTPHHSVDLLLQIAPITGHTADAADVDHPFRPPS